ncbi:hypothetical protein [Actinoplanes sp. NBRC 101535]|uniref:hypothetical protein n=1 Tax=Actinoplanes sp. NBRC 101535 TaxID=3032196 RepID=UPI0024A2A0C3|nr:hypothetical protein [Actinoplanes sp. NBRC 101535]GLY08263.1 hypothetical protein Acsp01_86420 [Actinoplanes sp. NBRC 101535]
MATGSIILSPGAATLPDGTSSNLAPAMQMTKSSATAPGVYFLQLAFDASSEEWCCWQFRMPDDYASSPVAKVQFKMASATSGGVVWDVRVSATTPGDAQDVDAQDFASANTGTTTVPGTAGYLAETSITLTNADSLAAGDFVVVRVARAAADGSDTATNDAELVQVALSYTTT